MQRAIEYQNMNTCRISLMLEHNVEYARNVECERNSYSARCCLAGSLPLHHLSILHFPAL